MFSAWSWHLFALVFAMLLSLPTAVLVKLSKKMALHQTLLGSQVEFMFLNDEQVNEEQKQRLLTAFNQASFLLKRPVPPTYSGPIGRIQLSQAKGTLEIHLYGKEVDIVRIRNGKKIAYQVRSSTLRAWLEGAPQN